MQLSRKCKVKLTGQLAGDSVTPASAPRYNRNQYVHKCERFYLQPLSIARIDGINLLTLMPPDPSKLQALRSSGTLNPRPEKVRHPRFADTEFFDPHDLVQLKYETLRAIETDGQPLAQAAVQFGLSRPTIYQARQAFQDAGLEGLFPHKRGPKGAHKLTPEIRQYLEQSLGGEPQLKAAELARRVRQRFGVQVHPRTLEKALHKAKRGRLTPPPNQP
jgi:transposase